MLPCTREELSGINEPQYLTKPPEIDATQTGSGAQKRIRSAPFVCQVKINNQKFH